MPIAPEPGGPTTPTATMGEQGAWLMYNGIVVRLVPTQKGGLYDSKGQINFGFTDRYRIQLPDGKTLPAGARINWHAKTSSFEIDLPNSRSWLKIGTNGDIYKHDAPGLFGQDKGLKNAPSLYWRNAQPTTAAKGGKASIYSGPPDARGKPTAPRVTPAKGQTDLARLFGGAGGGGGAGGAGGGGGFSAYTSGGVPKEYAPDTRVSINTYGYIAKLAKGEPDLAKLMKKYAGEDLGNSAVQAKLEAEIRDTKWWTSHTDAYRQAEILKATDPATFNKNVGEALPGVQKLTRDYLVPMSGATQHQWALKLASGQVTEAQYENYVKEQAKSLFPGMGAAIDSGVTTSQYVQPYADVAAQTLELDPAQVNFLDPKWSKALFQVDPKTGARTSMSLADWQTHLRTDPAYKYDKTQQAKQQASDLTAQLAKTFGVTG